MEKETIKNAVTGIVTKPRLKKLGALLVLAAIVTGGASYYLHEQKIAHRTAAAAARSAMITAQAERENVSLISEAEARAIAATAIGKDERALTFRRVELINAADRDEKHEKRDKHDNDKKHEKGEHRKDRRVRGDVTPDDYFRLVEAQRERGITQQAAATAPAPQPAQPSASAAVQPAPAAPAAPTQPTAGVPAPTSGTAAAPAPNPPVPMQAVRPTFLPVYSVTCTEGTVKYKVRIDAVHGTVLSSKVDD